jgi:hypothetical protein
MFPPMSYDRSSLATCREISLQSPVTAAPGGRGNAFGQGSLSDTTSGCFGPFDVNEKAFLKTGLIVVARTSRYRPPHLYLADLEFRVDETGDKRSGRSKNSTVERCRSLE